jgi:ATP-dependent DNA helicase RecG
MVKKEFDRIKLFIREGEGLTLEFNRSPKFALKEKEGERSTKLVEGWAERLVERLAENQKKILILIARNPRVSNKAMAQSLGISTTAIDKNLTTLKQKGLIRRVGPDKGGYWEVVGMDSGNLA